MIGTFVRSTHHLKKSGGLLTPIPIIGIRQNNLVMGEIVIGHDKNGKNVMFFFQNINNNVDYNKISSICDDETTKVITSMLTQKPRCMLCYNITDLRHFGTQFLMLPKNFRELYDEFTAKNRKVLATSFNKYVHKEDALSMGLFAICESGNLFSWAVKAIRQNRITFMTIYRIMCWQNTYSQLVNKLKKGTITAYNSTPAVLELLKECQELRKNKRANDIINMFNTDQKKLLRNNFEKIPIDLLNKFAILSSTKQQNFIRKVSTINDLDEIIRLLAFTTSAHFEWNKDSLIDYINNVEGLNCKIILVNDTSVLVQVEDYETIKKLAKTTNWCISKNKTYWNNYMKRSESVHQFVLFDFSKKEDDELSIVGFTTCDNKGITHAHSFTNVNLMEENDFDYHNDEPYNDLLRRVNTKSGIYAVISNNNIPLSLITKFRSRFGTWTKEEFLKVFSSFISADKYTIYYEDEKYLIISTKDIHGIFNLLGDKYINKFGDTYSTNEHIFFLDFNKDTSDNDKLRYTIVVNSMNSTTCFSTISLYNEYGIKTKDKFNKLIKEKGLPYDIICRPDTIKNRFSEAITNHDVEEMSLYLEDDSIKALLTSNHNNQIKEAFKQELINSITAYRSTDLVDMLDKHGYNISMVLSLLDVKRIFERLYNNANYQGDLFRGKKVTKDGLFNDLLKNSLGNYNAHQQTYIANYYLANRILTPYLNNPKEMKIILTNFIKNIGNYSYGGIFSDEIYELILPFMDFTQATPSLVNFISTALNVNSAPIIEYMLNNEINDEIVRNTILSYSSSKYATRFKQKWGIKEEKKESIKVKFEPFSNTWATTVTASNPYIATYTMDNVLNY